MLSECEIVFRDESVDADLLDLDDVLFVVDFVVGRRRRFFDKVLLMHRNEIILASYEFKKKYNESSAVGHPHRRGWYSSDMFHCLDLFENERTERKRCSRHAYRTCGAYTSKQTSKTIFFFFQRSGRK